MNDRFNRRSFLKTATMLPLGAAVGIPAISTADQGEPRGEAPKKRETPPSPAGGVSARLKVSLNAYSFNKLLVAQEPGGKPEKTLFDALDFCAKHNFDAIDPTGYYFPGYPKVPADAYIHDFKRKAFKLGVEISGTGVRNNFAQPDKSKRAADVQLVKEWIEVAAKMGAPVIRVFAGAESEGYTREQINEWMAADLKQCVEHGKRFGVLVGVQNHGDFLKTSEQVLEIVKRVDSEWFGVIVDTGNFQVGDPYAEIARVMPYAVNFQLKESPYGKDSPVRTDLKKMVQVLRASGYRGYLPIETLAPADKPYDPEVEVPRFLREVREAIVAVG